MFEYSYKCIYKCMYLYAGWIPIGKGFPDIEDQENWHGKPLGAKAESSLAACKAAIQNQGPHGLKPLAIIDDAPHFTIPEIKLSSPPDYKLGEKVGIAY